MIGDNPKDMAKVILGGLKTPAKGEPTADTSGDTDGDFEKGEGREGLRAAADEMIAHMHAKNADGLLEAMDAYYTIRGNASNYNPKTGQNDD